MKHIYVTLFVLSFQLFAAGEISLSQYGNAPIDAIPENSTIGTKLARIHVGEGNTNLPDHYSLSLSDETHFSIVHRDTDNNGSVESYIESKTLRDYEKDPSSYSFTIIADSAGKQYTLDHTVQLKAQNDSAATCKSLNGLPIKENTALSIDIATMLLDTNGVLWKDFSEFKVSDGDLPADANRWWIGDIIKPTKGALTWSKDGTFQYNFPAQGNEAVADTFFYTLYDSATYDSTILYQGFMFSVRFKNISDEPPVAVDDTIIVDEAKSQNTLINGISSVLFNDSDPDNSLDYDNPADGIPDTIDFHTVSLLPEDSTTAGTLLLNSDGTFTYTHDGSNTFTDDFSYIIDDGTFTDIGKVTIIINPLNTNPPFIQADTLVLAEGATATVLKSGTSNLLALATDADLPYDTLTITPIANVATTAGTVTILADGTFTYTHNGSEVFNDAFRFTITDEVGTSTTATIPIVITPVSDIAPIAVTEQITVVEGATAMTTVTGATSLLANDTDIENDISGLLVTVPPIHGTLHYDQVTGTFSYAHDGSETVADSFIYYATDGINNSAPVQVSISITPNLTVSAPLSTTLYNSGCLLDVSGTVALQGSVISVTGPLSGISGTITATGNNWDISVQPLNTYEGPDTLVVVSSLAGTVSDTILVPVQFARAAKPFGYTLISVNDPVTFSDSTSALFTGVASYLWDFGDGTTSTIKDPSHRYAQPGIYTVTEVVSYYNGCSDTLRATLSVFNNISPTTENYFLDINADGMMDRITLTFPAAITKESLTGISFHFTWLSAAGTVMTLSPTIEQWIFETAQAATIYFEVPQGATADNLTSIGTGYGTGQLVSGDRVETIVMKDGMAPVITYARIPEALPNTVLLSYSEPVAQPAVSPQPFDLLDNRTGLPYGAVLSQVDAVNVDRAYNLTALTGAFRIKANDRIWINPNAFISDMTGNIQNNPLNKKVPVLVPATQLTCDLRGFSPVDPKVQSLAFVSENLVQAAPPQLSTGSAFDIHLNYPIEPNNVGIKFVLMDPVGNVLCSIDKVGVFEDELFVTSSATSAQLIRVLWSGRNLQQRIVGGGTYMAIATVTDLTTGVSGKATTLIKVLQ